MVRVDLAIQLLRRGEGSGKNMPAIGFVVDTHHFNFTTLIHVFDFELRNLVLVTIRNPCVLHHNQHSHPPPRKVL